MPAKAPKISSSPSFAGISFTTGLPCLSFRDKVSVTDGSGTLKKRQVWHRSSGSSYWPQFVINPGTGRCEKSIWLEIGPDGVTLKAGAWRSTIAQRLPASVFLRVANLRITKAAAMPIFSSRYADCDEATEAQIARSQK
jgi:hypothetical protein